MQGDFRSMAKERRSKIQLYYDIVSAIVEDSQNNDSVSPTRIQFKCNTSYDKLCLSVCSISMFCLGFVYTVM